MTTAELPHYIGRVSCAVTGCHGHNSLTPISWSNAYQLWDSTDPHRWAFDVLYTERSYRMYEKLEQPVGDTIDKTTYLKFLQAKCAGCHATPPAGTGLASAGTAALFAATDPEVFAQGVSCESCHGPASDWEGRHFLKSWQEAGSDPGARAGLATKHHLQDLRPLANRAAVCMKCHVGPQVVGEKPNDITYDVNHDLIAAGHPRLNFEFNAYLTNLPKHWDEAVVWQKQGKPVPASFYFETWQAGQLQKLKQVATLQETRPQGPWTEFANHDCRECHHTIGEPNFRWNARKQWTLAQLTTSAASPPVPRQADLLQKLIIGSRNKDEPSPGFDEAVDLYLAAKALSQDQKVLALTTAADALGAAIERQHQEHGGTTQYDLTGKFNPQTAEFKQAIEALETELKELSAP